MQFGRMCPKITRNRLIARQTPSQLPVDGARLQSIGKQIWIADRELAMIGGLLKPGHILLLPKVAVIPASPDGGKMMMAIYTARLNYLLLLAQWVGRLVSILLHNWP